MTILTLEQVDSHEIAVLNWSIEWATIAPMSGVIVRATSAGPIPAEGDFDEDEHVGSVADWLGRGPLEALDRSLLPLS